MDLLKRRRRRDCEDDIIAGIMTGAILFDEITSNKPHDRGIDDVDVDTDLYDNSASCDFSDY